MRNELDIQHETQRLRKSGFWLNGKFRISLLVGVAVVALFVAGCGSSNNAEEVLVTPQAAPEEGTSTVPAADADSITASTIPAADADPIAVPASVSELDWDDFDASQTCNQEGEIPDAAFANLIASAASLNEAFPSLSNEGSGETASSAQIAAFVLSGCDVGVEELQEMAQDGKIGVETNSLIQAVTSENLADFPNTYMESYCLRAGTENDGRVLQAPHRVVRVVTALRDMWLAIQQPDSEEFQQVMTDVSERLLGDIWDALIGDDDEEIVFAENPDNSEQVEAEIQQTCGYNLVDL